MGNGNRKDRAMSGVFDDLKKELAKVITNDRKGSVELEIDKLYAELKTDRLSLAINLLDRANGLIAAAISELKDVLE